MSGPTKRPLPHRKQRMAAGLAAASFNTARSPQEAAVDLHNSNVSVVAVAGYSQWLLELMQEMMRIERQPKEA